MFRKFAHNIAHTTIPSAARARTTALGLALSCTAAVGVFTTPPAKAQRDFSAVTVTSEKISPTIAVLFGAGGNIAVFHGNDGTLLIDDQYAPLTVKITAAIADLGAEPVDWLINTHWHGDHVGGNENFGTAGAMIMAQAKVRQRMSGARLPVGQTQSVPVRPPSPKAALPMLTWNEGITLYLNGDIVDIHHAPHAHTDGDSIIHWRQANVIHMGDIFFHQITLPFIDLASGGSIRGTLAAVDYALALADDETVIIPGHGPLARRTDLTAYRTMIAHVTHAVAKARRQGKNLAEIQAMKPAKRWDVNPKPIISGERFIAMIYKSLAQAEAEAKKQPYHREPAMDGDSAQEARGHDTY